MVTLASIGVGILTVPTHAGLVALLGFPTFRTLRCMGLPADMNARGGW